MKKTLTVNISGIVFHIDEDAYNVLNDYLQSIMQHFSRTEGGDEIISDIEARIAEMLKERIGDERQVITIDDIEEVIKVIGLPSEFGEELEDEATYKRDNRNGKKTKRLYRDPDNEVLGGVCGGLGAYFRADPVWFRIAFVVACIPGFGTPILVYVILWAIIPEANTVTEKLEMKGEKVNISNIEKSIKEEIDNLKNKFSDLTNKAKRSYKKKRVEHSSDFQNVGVAIGRVAEIFVKVILGFVGIILIIIGIGLILTLLGAMFGFGNDIFIIDSELIYISFPAMVDLILGQYGSNMFLTVGLVLFLGIPLFMLLYGGVKLIFGIQRTRFVGLTAFNLWIIGLILCGYYTFKIAKSFSQHGVHKETVSLNVPTSSPLVLDVGNDNLYDRIYRYEDYVEVDEANMILTSVDDDLFFGIPQLEIERGNKDFVELEFFYRARGKSDRHATERAEGIIYEYSLEDNKMTFDPFFKLDDHEVWRKQQVDIVIKMPDGYHIQLSDDMYKILDNRRHSAYRLSGETWMMTENGLEESDFEPVEIEEIDEEDQEEVSDQDISRNEPQNRNNNFFRLLYSSVAQIFGFVV